MRSLKFSRGCLAMNPLRIVFSFLSTSTKDDCRVASTFPILLPNFYLIAL